MKLFHRGYQGKHERGQVPQQRDTDTRQPAADDQDTQDTQEAQERLSDPKPDASTRGADLPAQRPSATDESTDSSQPRS
ncbi:MAG: hypothetical protein JWM19_480 [Actinomycetia bacterium]|nr:hypothetical protein [Actinomycetes bacterium]